MKILITGAGGAAAISVWKSLNQEHELYMADIDPCAAGLYLVPAGQRKIIPRGDSSDFIPRLLDVCRLNQIELLIPTVDVELLPLAMHKTEFSKHNIQVPISPEKALNICRDKFKLLKFCEDTGFTPSFFLLNKEGLKTKINYPCFAKPRFGSGSNGVLTIYDKNALSQLPMDGSYLIQELLPGQEFSVDVYIQSNGQALASVPRLRLKIDSGIAVACQTRIDQTLSMMALEIAKKVGITYVANIQFKANSKGEYKLLEINPRFPGTLPLTTAAGIDIPKLLIKDIHGELSDSALLPFKELMVVRYWIEQFIPISDWQTLCQS
ncbi:ATP-grasp domain-containing protein [Legionella jordanis]|uniref:Carbamoyl phosphate synthase-like protein n=1 Tax=Legionella jordanis TaxID=456 RepID=A0A0W0VCG3_9GAMM|nr:ATP-grasp domain-containing protein [Legionella jordanis]KTD17289.1 carbamoyl phosphate synthase-like protein [Legionella jordanis]RMW99466.1 ATP-grasp domain-containing protein [Legionella jordanis]RMX15316.1 ATP-grasp domain-containing protein [Legionella jordanis]VEH12512.1 carbamoyl phosphate synthase-like protein [Legionella jordanis]HAT8715238.1 ATP-grasp domain-containing protein [Legionella jordanis]